MSTQTGRVYVRYRLNNKRFLDTVQLYMKDHYIYHGTVPCGNSTVKLTTGVETTDQCKL